MSPLLATLPHILIRTSSFLFSLYSFRRSATSAFFRAHSPVVSARMNVHTHARTHLFLSISSAVVFRAIRSRVESEPKLNVPQNYRIYAFVEFRSTRDAEDAYYDMYVLPYFFSSFLSYSLGTDACSRVHA